MMDSGVYCAQPLGNGRYMISVQRSFLGIFKWLKPLPDIYVEYDRLVNEKKYLAQLLKDTELAIKREKSNNDSNVKRALESWQQHSRKLPSRRRSIKAGDFKNLPLDFDPHVFEEDKAIPKRAPPSVSVHTAADIVPSKSNQQPNKKRDNGN